MKFHDNNQNNTQYVRINYNLRHHGHKPFYTVWQLNIIINDQNNFFVLNTIMIIVRHSKVQNSINIILCASTIFVTHSC